MKYMLIAVVMLCVESLSARFTHGQGATQAIRDAAGRIQQTVQGSQGPITAGPADKSEKLPPGKIDSNPPREFTSTNSGLKYRVLRKSDGKKPKVTDSVEVHYKGWLDDGTIFDSSYRSGKAISFPLNRVIKGWTEGMQLIGEGGMIELNIPHQIGYGERGTPGGPIPPRAQLHFIVELISIK